MSNFVPNGEPIATFHFWVLIRIKRFIDKNFAPLHPQGTQDLGLITAHLHTKFRMQVIKIERKIQVLFENFFHRHNAIEMTAHEDPCIAKQAQRRLLYLILRKKWYVY